MRGREDPVQRPGRLVAQPVEVVLDLVDLAVDREFSAPPVDLVGVRVDVVAPLLQLAPSRPADQRARELQRRGFRTADAADPSGDLALVGIEVVTELLERATDLAEHAGELTASAG